MRIALPLLLTSALAAAQPGCAPPDEMALAQLNAARAQPQRCGAEVWPAVPPLRWQPQLAEAAQGYALELAARDRVSHVGVAGESLARRVRASGYPMRRAGENLAGGLETLDEVLAHWLASAAHCENLMAPDFQDAALACVRGPGELGFYWVLNLGRPMGSGRR
ncbi:MAG: hypothetical protein DI603_08625 [Roseateles depolymerans]|uniref:SCP domain-containing protein n=1 Tax=Roseateles depolymerans TaxID=76731 RepID=A0A2W5DRK2_9BURK|nr:MAG: hypothetical protein DI603_08625 [Roseateles depolymerans]